jgi:hypothetical protein
MLSTGLQVIELPKRNIRVLDRRMGLLAVPLQFFQTFIIVSDLFDQQSMEIIFLIIAVF